MHDQGTQSAERGHPVRQRAPQAQPQRIHTMFALRAQADKDVRARASTRRVFDLRKVRVKIPFVMKKRYLLAGASGVVAGAVAAKLLTRPRDVSWPDSINFIYHPEHSWFTTVDGVRIHYQEAGEESAPPMILIHGFISSNLVWNEVFLPLAKAGFHVIAPDLPGYGYSDKPADGEYTIAAQARAVLGLMDRLGIDQATIVGASYGGAVAAMMALDYPERVANLVLVGAVSNDQPKRKLLLRLAGVPVLGDIATPLFLGSRWILRKRTEEVYRRLGYPLDERKLEARHHLLATANTHRAMIRSVRRWSADRISREASLIRQPTMLVWGEEDTHIPISDAFRLREAIPNSRLIVFRHCGHLPPTEYPEKFVEAVADFCKAAATHTERPRTLEFKPLKKLHEG
jgi:pimeloyl-ACP methyl ester carboxylesterase